MKTKIIFKLLLINGRKQIPRQYDFHITPVLTFGQGSVTISDRLGFVCALALEWGYWAIGISMHRKPTIKH